MSGKNKQLEATYKEDRERELKRQNDIFERMSQPSPELTQWRDDQAGWRAFKAGGDFSKPPPGGSLQFDLWNPARVQKQSEQMAGLEGVGAAALGGNNSIAIQQSRDRMANENAQNAGAAYENAFKQEDAYFRGNAMPVMQMENSKWGSLYGQTSQNYGNAMENWTKYASRPSPWGAIIGGALQGAGTILQPWAAAKFGKPST